MSLDGVTLPAELPIGFVGAGRMAQALVSGIVASNKQAAICFIDPDDQAARKFCQACAGARRLAELRELCRQAEVLVLAVKPQVMPQVLRELTGHVMDRHLVISVAAGVTLTQMNAALGIQGLVRVMPNTPCLIGQGISAMACHAGVTAAGRQQATSILESVGRVVPVPESLMDAVTGLSGSGPAYVFTFIDALTKAGMAEGLPPSISADLALQTVVGSAALVRSTGQHPCELRDQVTSPGGTTLAGLQSLADSGFEASVKAAVHAATRRSQQLAAEAGGQDPSGNPRSAN
jgi:pyrroline-5-carboxylate reductase